MDLVQARASFPGLREATFLDSACVGIAPAQAAHAVEEVARRGAECEERDASEHHLALDRLRDERLLAELLDERILVSIRCTSGVGGIRVSTHYYNDESDLDRLVSALRRLRRRSVSRPAA